MYKCNSCGAYVSEYNLHKDSNGIECCPECESDDLSVAYECSICGEPITEGDVCEDHKQVIIEGINDIVSFLQDESKHVLDRDEALYIIAEVFDNDM